MDYIISDFDLNGNKNGIFFYDQQIFLEKDHPDMNLLRSYMFRLIVGPKKVIITAEDFLNRRKFVTEKLDFVHTCRLSDLLKQKVIKSPFGDHESFVDTYIDYDELLKTHYPDLLKYTLGRLERLIGESVPDPVVADLDGRSSEFLAFTEETADNWGGPFELNGRVGCGARVQGPRKNSISIDICDFSYYSCPSKICEELDEIAKEYNQPRGDYLLANVWNKKDRRDYFDKLSRKDQIDIIQSEISSRCGKADTEAWRDYSLYLFGNDDASYSKYFDSKEEVEKELIYLRKMQPLDFSKDILARGYFFTN